MIQLNDMIAQLDFTKDFVLEDDCVLMQPIKPNDAVLLHEFAINEPDIWKYSLIPANGADNMNQYITTAITARNELKEYPFIVFDKRSKEYAGSTRFYDIQLNHQTLQLGYTWYGKKFQGSGLNVHCKYLMLQFAFEQMNMVRVEFRADTNNARSIAAMKKIGCKEEGILRSNMKKADGSRRSSIVLSILKDEWFGGIQQNLVMQIQQLQSSK